MHTTGPGPDFSPVSLRGAGIVSAAGLGLMDSGARFCCNDGVSVSAPLLSELLATAWRRLCEGADRAAHAFHLGTFATVGEDGRPEARTVVLRRVLTGKRRLLLHTDARSPKVRQIRSNPRVSWLFYDPDDRIQIRVRGRAELHSRDQLADRQWKGCSLTSRRCYLAPHAPGRESSRPSANLPEELRQRSPSGPESEQGWENFLVVETIVEEMEWLELHADGHKRALFRWGRESLESVWLEP